MDETNPQTNGHKRREILWMIASGFIAVALAAFLLWFLDWRFHETTDDAYVHGNQVVVTSQVSGFVKAIHYEDTEIVKAGDTLITLDANDASLALEEAKNHLAKTVRHVASLFETAAELKAERVIRETEALRASQDFTHRKNVVELGGVSREQFEHAEASYLSSIATLNRAEHKLQAALAQIENTTIETHPLVRSAKDALRQAYINYRRLEVRSPVDGMVARRNAQVGEAVNPKDPLVTIVPLDEIWVNANYKETQLKNVRIGQHVELWSDLYGDDVLFHGRVVGISAGTGSAFSLLPPQNATGNWIKIVQRLPVRIRIEPEQIRTYPLRIGLSMSVRIDTRERGGETIPKSKKEQTLYETSIFNNLQEGADQLIEEIIEQNSQFSFKVSNG